MKITITRKQLVETGAVCSGLDYFDEVWPGGQADIEWTPENQIAMLTFPSVARWYFGWLVYKKILPMWSMSNADLSNANLSNANLGWADLSNADLRWADLSNANLSNANLSGADLSNANLSGANLSGANLRWATWSARTIWPDGFEPPNEVTK